MSKETNPQASQDHADEAPVKAFYGRDKKAEKEIKHEQEFPEGVAVKAKVKETGQDGREKSVSRQFSIAKAEYKNGQWHYQLKDKDGNLHSNGAMLKESELSWALGK